MGESFVSGDRLCEIVFPIATIGIDAKNDGVIAKIVVGPYETAAAESTIALYATNRDYYMNYLAESMEDVQDSEKMALTVEAVEEATKKPDAAVMMKVVKHLIQSGSIEAKSGMNVSCYPFPLVLMIEVPRLRTTRNREARAVSGAQGRRGAAGGLRSELRGRVLPPGELRRGLLPLQRHSHRRGAHQAREGAEIEESRRVVKNGVLCVSQSINYLFKQYMFLYSMELRKIVCTDIAQTKASTF